ncbi:hypothetical protein MPSEU_000998900 [Mayamaea pseudoterrestris]|nr:hypothetical protein MPSEU_000998900 [Mayamaea pseudoterrestris]
MFTGLLKTTNSSVRSGVDMAAPPPPSQDLEDTNSPPSAEGLNIHLKVITPVLQDFHGAQLIDKTEELIQSTSVLIFGRSWCPLYKDAVELLTQALTIDTSVILLDEMEHRQAKLILNYLKKRVDKFKSTPVIFIRGNCIGGCRELFDLYTSNHLERYTLRGLFQRVRALHTERVETSKLLPKYRGKAVLLPAWFPAHVNDYEVRLSSAVLACLSLVAAAMVFTNIDSARWIVFVMALDQFACALAGPSISPFGSIAMAFVARKKPDLYPGACKQVTAIAGCALASVACIVFFLGHKNEASSPEASVGAVGYFGCGVMIILAVMWGLEASSGVEVGKRVLNIGFRIGLLPDKLYRTHLLTHKEALDTWLYRFTLSDSPKPILGQPNRYNPLALKYKKKSEEWGKDDFDPIRHMRITYFVMPASIAGLALVYKIGGSLNTSKLIPVSDDTLTILRIQDAWFQAFSSVAAFIFIFMMFMYFTKALIFVDKVKKEWYCPEQATSFSYIFISCIIFGFLLYGNGDANVDPNHDSSTQVLGRVLYWVGSLAHVIFSIMKLAEWIGRRLELDHIHANWALLPIGLALAGFCTPIVGALSHHGPFNNGNAWLGRFYLAFAQIIFTPIYVITLYRAFTSHNSDFRERHGMWLWVAAQCMLGLSDYTICEYDYSNRVSDSALGTPGSAPLNPLLCGDRPVRTVAGGVFLFLVLCWATLPRNGFFFREEFHMGYWTICFALNILSAAATFFYTTNGWYLGLIAEMITIVCSAFAHVVVFMHTVTGLIRKHGVCTSADRYGPLSIIRYTHSAMRESREKLEYFLLTIDLDDESPESRDNLGIFAAHFNHFRIVHEEHMLHDQILINAVRELFPRRGRRCDDDHRDLEAAVVEFSALINMVLDPDVALDQRKDIVAQLQLQLPSFFHRHERHLMSEEFDVLPVGEKYLSLSMTVELVREMWKVTPPEKWDVIIDFTLNNLPRHTQRVRFLKVLIWCMPERSQQIGSMAYRNVDAIMWERLRCDVPAIVPRGLPHWRRDY